MIYMNINNKYIQNIYTNIKNKYTKVYKIFSKKCIPIYQKYY